MQKHTAYQIYNSWNRTPQPHIIGKTLNIQKKGRVLKAAAEKLQVTYNGKPSGIIAASSMENLKARGD